MAESYRRWRLPELWAMVAADNAADAHLHLATLRRQQTALETQRDRLRMLRDRLAEAWPPEKSDAATMFIQRVNDLIDAVTETALGAAEVRGGVELVANAIDHAREQLAPLVERYAKAQSVLDPRVGRQAQKSLDQEARRILMAADVTVHDAASKFTVALPDYARISTQTYVTPANGGTTSTGGGTAGGGGGTTNAAARLNGFSPPRFDPPAPGVDETAGEPVVLAESRAVTIDDSWRPGDIGAVRADVVSSRGHEPIAGVGRVLGFGAPNGTNGIGAEGAVRGVGAGAMRGVPGTVIGGPTAASSAGSVRGRPTHVAPAAARSMSAVNRPATGGGYQDRSFDEYVARRREPDDEQGEQWTVSHGVRPLLEAIPPARTHDPGPGVIGLDR